MLNGWYQNSSKERKNNLCLGKCPDDFSLGLENIDQEKEQRRIKLVDEKYKAFGEGEVFLRVEEEWRKNKGKQYGRSLEYKLLRNS